MEPAVLMAIGRRSERPRRGLVPVLGLTLAVSVFGASVLGAGPLVASEVAEPAQEAPPESQEEERAEELPVETVEQPREMVVEEEGGEPPLREGAVGGGRGPVVERIEVRSDAPLGDSRQLRQLIAVPVGERLTERNVRRTLRNLQATGAAYEVELYTRPAPSPATGDGAAEEAGEAERVVVVLVIRAAVQVTGVELTGELGLDRRTLEDRLLVAPGQPLIESRVLRSIYRLQELYEQRGYFAASVRLGMEVDEERKEATVTFRVDAGDRAEIGAVRFEGPTGPYAPAALLEPLPVRPGDSYRWETAREAAERLQEWLVEQQYRKAQVDPPREEVADDGKRVDLVYPIRVGPRVEVEIVGVPRKQLRKNDLLPFLSEQGYDEALVLQAVDRTRRHYQEEGHWQVEVEWSEEREQDSIRLIFEVVPGPVYTLQEIGFDGNEVVSDDKLAELMATAPKRLLALGSGNLVTATLEEDLKNIRSYYALQGYVGYKVGPVETRVEDRTITLVVPIEEGHRRQVVDLAFEGMEHLSPESVRAEIPLEGGGPFHPLLLEDSVRLIRGSYEQEGFSRAQVSVAEDWNEDRTLVDLVVEVIEGPRTVVDRVILRGNVRTADDVLEETVELEPGEPVSRSRLLEVERRLYGLGLFSRVEVELGPADLAEETRDVIIRVEEGRTQRVSYGVGYGTDDGFAGLFGYSHRNVGGRAITIQTDLRYGQKERLVRAVLDQPNVGAWNLPVLYTVAAQSEERPSYDVDRLVSQVEAIYQEEEWRYGLAFDYRIVNSTLNEDVTQTGDRLELVERRDQDVRISSLIPNLWVDRRNDPLEPSAGWSANVRFQYAFPLGEYTEAHFLKTFLQHTRYQKLAYGHLAASVRLGLIEPLADATDDPAAPPGQEIPSEPENLKIPIDERFFAGGDYSHRAYGKDELGIPGDTLFSDGDGRGGNGLLLLNLDYRFPVWGALGGVVFYDVGNIWPAWQEIDLSGLDSGVGLAVRYTSPIGPVRAGVAYKLDPNPQFDEDRWRFFLAVGNPF